MNDPLPEMTSIARKHPGATERRSRRRRRSDSDLPFSTEILDRMPDAVILTGLDGRIVRWLGRAEEIFGYSAHEASWREIGFLHHADSAPGTAELVARTLESGHSSAELVCVRKDGSQVPVEMTTSTIHDEDGEPLFLIVVSRDVSERRRVAADLQIKTDRLLESEEMLREERGVLSSILDNMAEGVVVIDSQRNFQFFNAAATRIVGPPPASADSKRFGLYRSDGRVFSFGESALARALAGENVDDEEAVLDREDSPEPRRLCASARPLRDATGAIQGAVCVFRDVTAQKKADEELRRQHALTDSLVRSSADAILAFDLDLRYTLWNPAMERASGRRAADVLGRRALDVFPSLESSEELRLFLATLEGESYFAANQTCEPLELRGSFDSQYAPLRNEEGEIVGGLALLREISQRKRLEEQLRESQKQESLGTLTGGVAHDFNNILNIVGAYASLIRIEGRGLPGIAAHVETIQKTVERGAGVVRQLLTVARRGDAPSARVQLNEIVEEVTDLVRETFPRSIEIRVELGADVPAVEGNANQIVQALLNLCLNARDSMPDGGVLSIRTEGCAGAVIRKRSPSAEHDQYACVCVEDTGTGMDEPTRRRVFEPFFTTKGEGAGTGLGLAVVFGIVETHGGSIDLRSQVGRGTRFRLALPAGAPEPDGEPREAKTERAVADARGRTVLFVEDEPLLLESVRQLLAEEGYRVLTASDGLAAVEVFEAQHGAIDVVVTDIGLPKLGGWEAFLRMKEIDPHVSAILVSGILGAEKRASYAEAGARRTLRKPYSAEELIRCVGEALEPTDSLSR
ncbi:MAG: PAS domain-containing protein [Acidobacteriota bacterium]